jgi:hypothetical protein
MIYDRLLRWIIKHVSDELLDFAGHCEVHAFGAHGSLLHGSIRRIHMCMSLCCEGLDTAKRDPCQLYLASYLGIGPALLALCRDPRLAGIGREVRSPLCEVLAAQIHPNP